MANATVEEKQVSDSNSMEICDTNDDPISRIESFIRCKKSLKFECIEGLSFLMYSIAMMEDELVINIIKNGKTIKNVKIIIPIKIMKDEFAAAKKCETVENIIERLGKVPKKCKQFKII